MPYHIFNCTEYTVYDLFINPYELLKKENLGYLNEFLKKFYQRSV